MSRPALTRRVAAILGTVALLFSSVGLVEARGAPGWLTRFFRAAIGRSAPMAVGDTTIVYGPKLFALGANSTSGTFVERITVAAGTAAGAMGQGYVLRVTNGYNGAPAITSGTVKLNGVTVASGSFSSLHAGQTVDTPVQVNSGDLMEATLQGPKSAAIRATLLAVPDPTFLVFGPKLYTRASGSAVTVTDHFTLPTGTATPRYLCFQNGDADGTHKNSSVTVKLNGAEIVSATGLNTYVTAFRKPVTLLATNTLEVKLSGTTGSHFTVCATATDATAPKIAITAPLPKVITRQTTLSAVGVVTDQTAVAVLVNGVAATLTAGTAGQTSFSATVPLATEGNNNILIRATDAAGTRTDSTRVVIRDTEAPVVTVNGLPDSAAYRSDSLITVSGTITDRTKITANLNGQAVTVDTTTHTFSKTIRLGAGVNFITLVATDAAGNVTTVVRQVTLDNTPPTLTVTAPAEGAVSSASTAHVTGTVTAFSPVTLKVNGASVTLGSGGVFAADAPVIEGDNTITVVATNAAGITTTVTRHVVRDTQAPALVWGAPLDNAITGASSVTVSGSVTDRTAILLTLNGSAVAVNASTGAFTSAVPLSADGAATLTLVATDAAGNITTATRTVTRDATGPALALSSPADGLSTDAETILVQGTATDRAVASVTVNGQSASLGAAGSFSLSVPLVDGANAITIVARDDIGNQSTTTRTVTRTATGTTPTPPPSGLTHESIPIDATIGAPALSRVVATSMIQSTSFLYTGPSPVQLGVIADSLKEARVALIRGRVVTSVGTPLAGARVTVRRHPELGSTLSRADGSYNLVVNGGGVLTLEFSKNNSLTAHRQVSPAWQGYASVAEVALLDLDTAVTTVLLAAPAAPVRASVVIDDDGRRQATLIFPQNTVATLVLPNGQTQPIETAHVRVTEYTVGRWGHAAMPAPLPATSAYTYAAEFSIDEAEQAGATSVKFNQPVPVYLENFLNSPVGALVPAGYYDREQEAWIPGRNGRVVRVVGVTDGRAQLDVTGAGTPSPDSIVHAIGISESELLQLSALYQPGQTLWRIALDHFSAWDFNHPKQQKQEPTPQKKKPKKKSKCEKQAAGSIIGCESQTLGEQSPLRGTPYFLDYRTIRAAGYQSARAIEIPVTGSTIVPNLIGTRVIVRIAGREFLEDFDATPNRALTFLWDGLDAYGREVVGTEAAEVSVGYLYPDAYVYRMSSNIAESEEAKAFGVTCTKAEGGGSQVDCVVPDSLLRGRGAGYQYLTWKEPLVGTWDARVQGFGGWTLNAVHAYTPATHTLELGDGTSATATELTRRTQRVAGNGDRGYGGDGGPAKEAVLESRGRMGVGPDGVLYIADANNNRVRRVTRDGVINTIAGTGSAGFSGDGSQATNAQLNLPSDVTVGPDGLVYILDAGNGRARRIDRNGIITTVPGSQLPGFWYGSSMKIAADGAMYFLTDRGRHLRRLSLDGSSTIVIGDGSTPQEHGNDPLPVPMANVPATQAPAEMTGFALGADGRLYETEPSASCVRVVGTDGIIRAAGNPCRTVSMSTMLRTNEQMLPASYEPDAEGRAALYDDERFSATDVAVSADGTLYFADYDANRIWRQKPGGVPEVFVASLDRGTDTSGAPLGTSPDRPSIVVLGPNDELYFRSTTAVNMVSSPIREVGVTGRGVMSPDGSELYVFDAAGRHERTYDASTSLRTATMTYDADGHVVAIMAGDSTVTRVERDAVGIPTAIVAPFGQRTALTVGANGYLSAISQSGRGAAMSYTTSGLLSRLIDAAGGEHTFTYDSIGLLIRDSGPDGIDQRLSHADGDEASSIVRRVTSLGRATTYLTSSPSDSIPSRTVIDPAGLVTRTRTQSDGQLTVATAPNGTTVSAQLGIDALTGQAQLVSTLIIETPRGLRRTVRTGQSVELSEAGNPLSLKSRTSWTEMDNGKQTTVYDATTRTLTITSAGGRTITALLDAGGRVTEARMPGLATSYSAYDEFGRVAMEARGADTTRYSYTSAGQLARISGPLGFAIEFTYDSLGELIRKRLPGGRDVTFAYDAAGRRTSITDPKGETYSTGYSIGGRRENITLPAVGTEGRRTQYHYDMDGANLGYTLPDGSHVDFTVDSTGRPVIIDLPEGKSGAKYGETTGMVDAIWTANGKDTTAFQYDGGLVTELRSAGQVNGTVSLRYNGDFRVQSIEIGADDWYAPWFFYDADGLLIYSGDLVLDRREDNGLLRGTMLGNIQSAWTHDSVGHVQSFVTLNAVADSLSNIDSVFVADYSYDALGRISTRREQTQGAVHVYGFTYDAAGRLASEIVDGSVSKAYDYDNNGNRVRAITSSGVKAATFDERNRMRSLGDATLDYSVNGALIRRIVGNDTTRFAYDGLGNLTGATLPGGTSIEYIIDTHGRRIGKRVNGTIVQRFLYQTQLAPAAEVDDTGAVVTRFVYATHANVPDYMVRGDSTYRLVLDQLGSVRMVVNVTSGSIAQRIDYDAFGVPTLNTQPGFQPFGYSGGLQDEDVRLVHFGAREYDPQAGRWTSSDPSGVATSLNLYEYANSQPVGYHDITGLAPQQAKDARPDLGALGNKIRSYLTSETEMLFFEQYWNGQGDMHLTPEQFQAVVTEAERLNSKSTPGKCVMVDGVWHYRRTMSLYGSAEYKLAYGVVTIDYDEYDEQALSLQDNYNFDWQDWNTKTRSDLRERQTRLVSIAGFVRGAKPFNITFP